MIDLHAHLLPGFDDGAKDWDSAVEMCLMAESDGIEAMVATPHFHRGLFPTPDVDDVRSALRKLQRLLPDAGCRLDLYLGSDCHVHPDIVDNLGTGLVPTINGSRYVLLEFSVDTLPPGYRDLIFRLRMQSFVPIITHPERNAVLAAKPHLLYELVEAGALAQVTAGSLTGLFGSRTQRAAEAMVQARLVQIVASDAHDPARRPPLLSDARDAAAQLVGDELSGWMVGDAPRAVLDDEPVHYPPPELIDRPDTDTERSGRSLLDRLLGR